MNTILPWLTLIIPSAITGALCAYFIKSRNGLFIAGGLPLLGFAIYLAIAKLMDEEDSGVAWIIVALLTGGIAAAFAGFAAYIAMFHAKLNGYFDSWK